MVHLFNEFRLTEFTRDDFFTQTKAFLRDIGEEVADRSIDDDFNCIINTYIPRIKLSPKKFDPEDNIDCPLGELGLIDIMNRKEKIYKKNFPKKNLLHPLIILAVILDQYNFNNPDWKNNQRKREVRISDIQTSRCNVGKVFNLDIITLTGLLYKLELLGFVKIIRTAGLDVIEIKTDFEFLDCINEYYRVINE